MSEETLASVVPIKRGKRKPWEPEEWPIDTERVDADTGFREHIQMARPVNESWRIRCYAWCPELQVFREFPSREGVAQWINRIGEWAVYADVEFQLPGSPLKTRTVWHREDGEDFYDLEVLDLIPR